MMTNFRTAAMAIAVAAAMTGTQALADGALAPGKPAGLQQAQRHGHNLLLISAAAAAVLAGVAVAVASSGNSSCSAANCPTSSAATGTSS
jgi:hypothetical protein